MRKTILISLILTLNLTFSQSTELQIEFRTLTGNLVDLSGEPLPGQNVMIKGTEVGTTTDFDGNFCLTIPKDKTIFIELPFCFDQILREIKPTDSKIELKAGKQKQRSKRAARNWKKIEEKLSHELKAIYSSTEYKTIEKNNCKLQ